MVVAIFGGKKMRKNGLVLAITILICVCALSACSYAPKITEYSDIKDYGVTKGTGTFKSDYRAKKEFFSFFPAEIDPSFEDVKYHYKGAALPVRVTHSLGANAAIAVVGVLGEGCIFKLHRERLSIETPAHDRNVAEPGAAGVGDGNLRVLRALGLDQGFYAFRLVSVVDTDDVHDRVLPVLNLGRVASSRLRGCGGGRLTAGSQRKDNRCHDQ